MNEFLQTALNLLSESAIFVLAGFLVAGALHVLISDRTVTRFLSARSARSVFLASAVGLPLPLCSCSVLPAAITLRKKGASRGATVSFLISTPETSAASVLLTYSLLGGVMAVIRPIAACITALTAGLVENAIDRRYPQAGSPTADDDAGDACCASSERGTGAPPRGWRGALRFAFVDLFDDIAGWVLVGIVGAAVLQIVLPEMVFRSIFSGSLTSMLVMIAIGVPLYVCAEASTPIAAVFIAQGLNPGAALVFLLVGPATNIGSLGALRRLLGQRAVVVYLVCIVAVALVMGAVTNNLLAQSDIPLAARAMRETLVPAWAKIAGAAAFLVMWLLSAHRLRYGQRIAEWLDRRLPVRVTPLRLNVAVIAVALVGYVGSGFFVVQPGELGLVRRFGGVQRTDVTPGLHYALPYPVDVVDRVPVQRVYRTVLGFRLDEDGLATAAEDPDKSWILIGDENIANIKCAVHWGAEPEQAVRYQYAVLDPESLVRSALQSALRQTLGGESIDGVFTAERRRLEREIEGIVRDRLAKYESGIRVDSCRFLDAHAPPQVHASFRDVASALEDRATEINRAWAEEATILPAARGAAAERLADAQGYVSRIEALARGEGDRFCQLLSVYCDWPAVTRQRLHFEMLDRVLPGRKKYVKPPGRMPGSIEIWFVEPDAMGRVRPEWAPPTR